MNITESQIPRVDLSYTTFSNKTLQTLKVSIINLERYPKGLSKKEEKEVKFRLALMCAKKRNGQWFVCSGNCRESPNQESHTRNQCISKCGIRRMIIYLGGVYPILLFIKKKRLDLGEAKNIR